MKKRYKQKIQENERKMAKNETKYSMYGILSWLVKNGKHEQSIMKTG